MPASEPKTVKNQPQESAASDSENQFPSVSIAIPVYNEEESLSGVLDDFLKSRYPNITEILIADGGSTDRTREIIQEYHEKDERVKLVDNPGKIQSSGINEMIKIAKGEVFLRADGHSDYAPDYVEKSVEALLESEALNAGGAQRFVARNSIQAALALASRSVIGNGGALYRDPDYTGYAETVYIGCYWTEILREMGGFSTNNGPNEDAEMNTRLLKKKPNAIYISSEIRTWYYPRTSLKALYWQFYYYGRGRRVTHVKHRDMSRLRGRLPFYIFMVILLFMIIANSVSGFQSWTLLVPGFILALLFVSSVQINLRYKGAFNEEFWRGEPGKEPSLISRILLTFICLVIMPVAHSIGYLYQVIRQVFTGKKEW